jgi:outer membrane receptor protein involved in Fe transport
MVFLTVTGRNDWESQLAYSKYKCFFYPSVGLSAVLSSMFDAPEWLTYLKVRGSYTIVGNSYGRFMTTASYPYNEQNKAWETTTTYPNYDLKPERTKSWEVGVDANFFEDLSLKLTYYRSNTFNQTFHASLPASSGYTSIPIQSGNIMNQGVELGLGYDHTWGDFSFGTYYTLTWNQNKVIKLADGAINPFTGQAIEMSELIVGGFGQMDARAILREGGSMGDVYGQRVLTRDLNGYILHDPNTGLSTEVVEDYYLGSILPKANMGLSFDFGWKGLKLGMTFNGRIGGIVISETQSNLDKNGVSEASAIARDNGGVKINSGMVPAQSWYEAIGGIASHYTYDATNVRLGELSLNYTLPREWFNKKCGLTLGFVAKNLWMIYCKAPFDPEMTTAASSNYYQGFDSYMLPSTRSLGFNVRLQF